MPRSARTSTSRLGTPRPAKVVVARMVALVGAAEEAADKGIHSRVVCLTTLVPPAAELEKRYLTEEGRAVQAIRAGPARKPEVRLGGLLLQA